jgi:hypothetical protein
MSEQAAAATATTTRAQENPFLKALVISGLVLFLLGIVATMLSMNSPNPIGIMLGGISFILGLLCFVGYMVAGAITWKPKG